MAVEVGVGVVMMVVVMVVVEVREEKVKGELMEVVEEEKRVLWWR